MSSQTVLAQRLFNLARRGGVVVALVVAAIAPLQVAAHASGGTSTGADLQMSGSASNGSPHDGDAFTLTYLVKNNGPQTATGATFLDKDAFMATGATVNGNSASCGIFPDAATGQPDVQCNLGDMAPSAQATVVESAVASCGCQIVLTPTVTSTVTDPNLANNTASVTIKVQSSSTTTAAGGGTTTTTGGGGGGGGGTTATPGVAGPCASVVNASTSGIPRASTNQGASGTETMTANVTSCSSLTQSNLRFDFVAGPNIPTCGGCFSSTEYSWVFTCQVTNSFNLSPGATVGVSCNVPYQLPPDITVSGIGTATVHDATGASLATGSYGWAIDTSFAVQPAPPPNCPRAGCAI